MQKDKKFYDEFYTRYPVDIHNDPRRFQSVSALLSGRVLDVACGTGTLAEYYAGDYLGIDISDVAIEKAKATRRKDAKFQQIDITKAAPPAGVPFDSVYFGEFLEHIDDDVFVFEQVLKLAKPDARIVASVPNAERVPDESHARTFTVPQIRKKYSEYGRVRFHKWPGFSHRILFSISLGEKKKDEISLVMIVKDEQKGIERAIISALELVDRVVVSVDTKTRDKTPDIAELYADELKFHDWKDDFSAARNSAQENVKSRWILFLDGHEYVEETGKVADYLKEDLDGIFVTVRMETGMTFLYPRLYRAGLQFKNKIHNLVDTPRRRGCPSFVIVHDRITGQDPEAADRRNKQREGIMPQFLKQQIKENPKNVRAHFHLANFYLMSEKLKEAKYHYKKVAKFGQFKDEKFMALISLGRIHVSFGNSIRAHWYFNKADALQPGRWETARVLGGFYFLQKHYKKALDFFVKSLAPNTRHYGYEPMKKNLPEIWDMIAHSFTKIDRPDKAIVAWQRAIEVSENEKQKKLFQTKLELVRSLVPASEELKIAVKDENEKGKV